MCNVTLHAKINALTQGGIALKPLYISFSEKSEIVLNENLHKTFPIGKLLFSFLEINWKEEANHLQEYLYELEQIPIVENSVLSGYNLDTKNYLLWAAIYQKLYKRLETYHPMLAEVIDHQMEELLDTTYLDAPTMAHYAYRLFRYYPESPMKPEEIEYFSTGFEEPIPDQTLIQATNSCIEILIELFSKFDIFQMDLTRMIHFALDTEGQYPHLSTLQRYHLMQLIQYPPYQKCKNLFDKIKIARKILSDSKMPTHIAEITEDLLSQIAESNLSTYSFYTSTDLIALVFCEFDYLCAENFGVKRCVNCGNYFLPFSNRSIYCSRISPQTGKACKDTAAATTYRQKVAQDEAKKYYQKQNNAYQMRCSRNPSLFPKEKHWQWQDMAKEALKELENGTLSFEEFQEKIAIPKLK